jgi:acyl-CoA thioesterase FadM
LDDSSTIVVDKIVDFSCIDRNGHMNNSKFIYELNFSRRIFFNELGIWTILKAQNLNLVIQAQTIRYRKELKLWQKYKISTRIISWSDREGCFYIETKFISTADSFIVAIHHAKYRLVVSSSFNSNSPRDLKYLSPTFLLKKANLLPSEWNWEEISYSDSNSFLPESSTDKSSFLGCWERANSISSKTLNPHR